MFVVSVPLAQRLSGVENNDAGSYLPKSAESTRVLDIQNANFPDAKTLDGVVVYQRASGITAADTSAHFTGPAGVQSDSNNIFNDIDTKLLFATVLVVVVVLLITYRSPVLWLIPVIGAAAVLELAQAVFTKARPSW